MARAELGRAFAIVAVVAMVANAVPTEAANAAVDHDLRMSISANTPVAPQGQIVAQGQLTDFGEPSPGAGGFVSWACTYGGSLTVEQDIVTATDGTWEVTFNAGACTRYEIYAWATPPGVNGGASGTTVVQVLRAPSDLGIQAPQSGKAGQTVVVSADLTSSGAPVAGAEIMMDVGVGGYGDRVTGTTDDGGHVAFPVTFDVAGTYRFDGYFFGDDFHQPSETVDTTIVSKIDTALTINGPDSAVLDQPISLTGQFTGAQGPVDLTLTNPDGSVQTITTAADGSYAVETTPGLAHYRTWRVTYPGDDAHLAATATYGVTIPALPASFSDLTPTSVEWSEGGYYQLSGRLNGVPAGSTVKVSGYPGSTKTTTTTNIDGWFSIALPIGYDAGTTYWTLSYLGDGRHDPTRTTHAVEVVPIERTLTATGPARVAVGAFCEIAVQTDPSPTTVLVTDPAGNTWEAGSDEAGHLSLDCEQDTEGSKNWTISTLDARGWTMASASVQVNVVRVPQPSIRTNRFTYVAGDIAQITVRPGGATDGFVRVLATRAGQAPVLIWSGSAPSTGVMLTRPVRFNERLTVVAPANASQNRATGATSYVTRLRLTTEFRTAPIATDGKYAVFAAGTRPIFRTASNPVRPGRCESYWVYRMLDGQPHLMSHSPCLTQSKTGRTHWQLPRTTRGRLMLLVVSPGDALNTASSGNKLFFRIR